MGMSNKGIIINQSFFHGHGSTTEPFSCELINQSKSDTRNIMHETFQFKAQRLKVQTYGFNGEWKQS